MQYSYNNSNVLISAVCPLQGKQTELPSSRAGMALGPEGNPLLVGIRAGPRSWLPPPLHLWKLTVGTQKYPVLLAVARNGVPPRMPIPRGVETQ